MSLNVWIVNGEAKQYFALNSNFLHYKVKNGITRNGVPNFIFRTNYKF